MSEKDIVIVFDCGATNVRVIAIDSRGNIVASESFGNNSLPDPFYPSYRIWDVDDIWQKMSLASRRVVAGIDIRRLSGVTVTTFGVDGTLFDKRGKMLYPVISWQCERTRPVMENIDRYITVEELYNISGVLPFNFNTINKLIWLKENKPDLVDRSAMFLFMPSIFSFFLTGEMINDATMTGTSMFSSLNDRNISSAILDRTGFPADRFGKIAEPGTITGRVTAEASDKTGIPAGVPVVATGHDTQFAIFGSGAGRNQPVLSSGTWEILMVRSGSYLTGEEQLAAGITTELDSVCGLYDIGKQWIASGILEWARKTLFNDMGDDVYEKMIAGAETVPPGSNGVKVNPKFYEELKGIPGGSISGLTMESTRYEIYRAILEALAEKLAEGVKTLEKAGGFRAENILCVGGGSRNRLWNKLRANYTGLPVKIIDCKETTVLGASLFVQYACGNAASPEEARKKINYRTEVINP